MKYFGLILILTCSFLIGYQIKSSFTKRVSQLEKCIEMLELISINLSYISLDTVSILEMLINSDNLKEISFIDICLNLVNRGNNFYNSWNEALNSAEMYLKPQDKDILLSFGAMLGKSDIDGQIRNCEIGIQKLSVNLNKAKEQRDKYANLYFRLSIFSGILISLIII